MQGLDRGVWTQPEVMMQRLQHNPQIVEGWTGVQHCDERGAQWVGSQRWSIPVGHCQFLVAREGPLKIWAYMCCLEGIATGPDVATRNAHIFRYGGSVVHKATEL